jgi:hypothetical protein
MNIKKILWKIFPKICAEIEIDVMNRFLFAQLNYKKGDNILIYEDDKGIKYEVKVLFKR